jgi:hypothetical protein
MQKKEKAKKIERENSKFSPQAVNSSWLDIGYQYKTPPLEERV